MKRILSVLLSVCLLFAVVSCETVVPEIKDVSAVLVEPAKASPITYDEYKSQPFTDFKQTANGFAYKFSPLALNGIKNDENSAVSPLSVFMALCIAGECSNGETQNQILSALGLSLEQMRQNFSLLYRQLNRKYYGEGYDGDVLISEMSLTNSIWLDESLPTVRECLDTLGNDYYCFGKSVDFNGDNQSANDSIRKFIKDQTHGLIDKNFDISPETIFTIINTLYLKDLWNSEGDELQKTSPIPFTNADGTVKNVELLMGRYLDGKVFTAPTFSGFYTTTASGLKLKFILPNDGYTAKDVFTQENLALFNSQTDFNWIDVENKIKYHTRCLFPEYNASFDQDVLNILKDDFGIIDLFDIRKCDFGSLIGNLPSYCSGVSHVTSLNVNAMGIEGAAVTVMPVAGATGPDEYTEVYLDFTLDKPFGFMLCDVDGTVLFSGIVNNI